jgi:hypothetical protein
MRPIRIAIVVVAFARIASAETMAGPQWVSGPDRAYNCTHYLDQAAEFRHAPQVKPGEPMKLVMRRDKEMTFALAAKAKRGKVHFELDGTPPPGAKIANAKFTWMVAGAPSTSWSFGIVAVGDDGGRTRWPIDVRIADDRLVAAWSAGMGSVWPDCDVYADSRFTVEDLDGDGKDDVIFRNIVGSDGTTEAHVMLQRGTLKFTEAHTCMSCAPTREVAADGTPLLVIDSSCCCHHTISVFALDGDRYASAGGWDLLEECSGQPDDTLDFDRDTKNRITGATQRDPHGKVTKRFRWRDTQLVER